MKPGDFDGVLRTYAMQRPRDVAPGRVSVQWFHPDGTVRKESDIFGSIIREMRPIARQYGYTLDQMLARVICEQLRKLADEEESFPGS